MPADMTDIKKRGAEMQVVFIVTLVLANVSVIGDLIVFPLVRFIQRAGAADWAGFAPEVGLRLVGALPVIVLMTGLWFAQRMFGRVGEGDVFCADNARDLERIGGAMGLCGVTAVFFTPTFRGWIDGSSRIDIDFEGWAIVLALLGGAITLIGRMWALAVEIKTEADQIV